MANLLIVDDDSSTRTFLSLALQRDGHHIREVANADDCLRWAHQESQDMILLDAQLPGMDGFTCCSELKAQLRDRCPPIIMITGLLDKASVDRAFSAGAVDYTTKPIHISVLRHRIRQVLRERELMQQLAVTNQQLTEANRELQALARLDSLTQIANRRYFEEVMTREWARLMRQQMPLGVLLCDVDFFKLYNDLYGHLMGDRCLYDISQVLRNSLKRPADLVARYGGEEFVILLPDTHPHGVQQVANSLHIQVGNAAIPHAHSTVASTVTLSVGAICGVPSLTATPKQFLEIADQALYEAKDRGRNQTVMRSLLAPPDL